MVLPSLTENVRNRCRQTWVWEYEVKWDGSVVVKTKRPDSHFTNFNIDFRDSNGMKKQSDKLAKVAVQIEKITLFLTRNSFGFLGAWMDNKINVRIAWWFTRGFLSVRQGESSAEEHVILMWTWRPFKLLGIQWDSGEKCTPMGILGQWSNGYALLKSRNNQETGNVLPWKSCPSIRTTEGKITLFSLNCLPFGFHSERTNHWLFA